MCPLASYPAPYYASYLTHASHPLRSEEMVYELLQSGGIWVTVTFI